MTFNNAPRRRFTKRQREAIFLKHGGICHWCKQPIKPGEPWAIEHLTAREMLRPDQDPDGDWNLDIIHDHPASCHKEKTKLDRAMIAKSNHVRRHHGLDPDNRKSKGRKQWPNRTQKISSSRQWQKPAKKQWPQGRKLQGQKLRSRPLISRPKAPSPKR